MESKFQISLASLIVENPSRALTFAFSPELLADLAAKFPQSAGLLEVHGTWQGRIEMWVADDFAQNRSITITKMKADGQTLQLYFARGEPSDLQTATTLKTSGVLFGRKLVVTNEGVR